MASDGVRLPVVTEQAATGETAQLYGEISEFFGLGFVPDVFQLTSTRPSFLRAFWEGFRSIFTEGVLSRETKELIAALVARDAGCRYCVDAHLLLLDMIGTDRQVVEAARVEAVGDMPVEPKVRALLEFVQRIDHEAYRITDTQFTELRDVGWSDPEILEGIWTACIFNAIVRLVDTLGLYRLGQLAEAPPAASPASPS
ncbi:MAG: carboxymuconolactone decarboxylase family protein [Acidimicrobiia bacterium]